MFAVYKCNLLRNENRKKEYFNNVHPDPEELHKTWALILDEGCLLSWVMGWNVGK